MPIGRRGPGSTAAATPARSNSSRRRRANHRPAVALVAGLVLGLVLVPTLSVAAASGGVTSNSAVTRGTASETAESTLELSTDAATVSDASYPDAYGMTTDPVVADDGRSVTVEAVDLDDAVTDGASDVTLATVAVTGTDPGSTALEVTDVRIDADGGSRIEPALEAGTLTVTADGPPNDPSRAERDAAPDDSDDGDGSNGSDDNSDGSPSDDDGESDDDRSDSGADDDRLDSGADEDRTDSGAADGDGDADSDDTDGDDDADNEASDESESVPGFGAGTAFAALAVVAAALVVRSR